MWSVMSASTNGSLRGSKTGALAEIVNPEDGSMARTPQLLAFAREHRLRCITIADLVRYRLQHDAPQEKYSSVASNGASSNGAML